MDAKIKKWKSLPTTLSDFVCAVPLVNIECKALAGILPERCPRLEQIQVISNLDKDYILSFHFTCTHILHSLAAISRD